MIVPVMKYLFIGVKEDLDEFFEKAQGRGIIEFIPTLGRRPIEPNPAIQILMSALKILRKQPVLKQSEKRGTDAEGVIIAENVIRLKNEIERLHEAKRITTSEIARVAPLGNFSMDEIHALEKDTGRKIQFFCMKCSKRDKLQPCDELIYLGTDFDLDYYMAINKTAAVYPEMIEMRVEEAAPALRQKLSSIDKSLHMAEHELKAFADQKDYLHAVLIHLLNDFNLQAAKKEVGYPTETSLFAIEAWVPENKVPALFGILQGLAVHCETIVIEEGDRIPTYMENKGFSRIGEDLVHIYDIPAHTDRDPSTWVLWSFAIFFAMIVADAGYGFLFLLISLFLYWKFPKLQGMGKRLVKLMIILSTACIAWGVLSTSYFGLEILPENPVSRVSLVSYLAERKADYHVARHDSVYSGWLKEYPQVANAKTGREFIHGATIVQGKHTAYPILNEFRDDVLLEISLLLGVIHIGCSLVRYMTRNWAALGWLIFMAGGYLFFPELIHATSMLQFMGWVTESFAAAVGIQMVFIGGSLAVVLALIQKRFHGLHEVMNVVTIFADVLSYLRLYALALAATIMAETFNTLGIEVGLAVGVLIIIGGHVVNIVLGVQSGIIHGLRLNFIEWYHYSFTGGGRLFRPLKKLKIR